MGKIKIGIIGCGHWGPNYIRVFQKIRGVSVEYVCDLDKKKLRLVKNKYPSVNITNNVKEILDSNSLDAVVIATPAKTHYSLTKQALIRGKHVLVEKPLAVGVREANELIDLSKKYKCVLMPGHIFEYHDGIKEIKKYISQEDLGKIYYMYSRRTNLGPIRNDVNTIWDLALHDISIFNFLLDAIPIKVSANGFCYLRGNIEDVGFVTLYYPKGIVSHIHVSWLDPRKIREIVIVGNSKMLIFDDLDYLHPIKIYDKRVMRKKYERPYYTFEEFKTIVKNGNTLIPEVKIREPLEVECESFLKFIKEEVILNNSLKRGLDVIKILQATESSLTNKGREIRIK